MVFKKNSAKKWLLWKLKNRVFRITTNLASKPDQGRGGREPPRGPRGATRQTEQTRANPAGETGRPRTARGGTGTPTPRKRHGRARTRATRHARPTNGAATKTTNAKATPAQKNPQPTAETSQPSNRATTGHPPRKGTRRERQRATGQATPAAQPVTKGPPERNAPCRRSRTARPRPARARGARRTPPRRARRRYSGGRCGRGCNLRRGCSRAHPARSSRAALPRVGLAPGGTIHSPAAGAPFGRAERRSGRETAARPGQHQARPTAGEARPQPRVLARRGPICHSTATRPGQVHARTSRGCAKNELRKTLEGLLQTYDDPIISLSHTQQSAPYKRSHAD